VDNTRGQNGDYLRWRISSVKEALKTRRVVVISGARQAGKTTLAKQISDKNSVFRPLDDNAMYESAVNDPGGFVKNDSGTMVIDEVQRVKKLLTEIKYAVDNNNRPGQYLLTGSANILTLPTIGDSLAGRVKYMRLRPLTNGEILKKKPAFLDKAFNRDFPNKISGFDKEQIINFAFRGGYPEAVFAKNNQHRKDWHIDYLNTILLRDLKDIANIRRKDDLQSLVGILASWSAKFMEPTQITAALSINKITLDSYINTLVSMFMFEKVSPWLKTDYERIGKRHKFYATDTGMMTSILGWNQKEVIMNNDRSGKLIETFIFQELAAHIDMDNKYKLYQYRDRQDREIDFLVEREDGALLGIEVKAGHSVSKDDFKAQKWFEENIIKNKNPYTGIILYSGDRTIPFEENMIAVPTATLWL